MKYLKKYNESKLIDYPFYIFGSANSQDYDVVISIDKMPKLITESHELCKRYNEELSSILPDKPLNCNLVVIKNGNLVDCFKGTCDELQNVIFYTYDLHKQYYDNPIKAPIQRDLDEKILRVSRFLITFYSRTHLRTEIKLALRSDLKEKLKVLKQIDYTEMTDFPMKKEKDEDIWKVIAFQLGQVFSLIDGHEKDSYSKNGIIKNYPDLSNFLNRKDISFEDLETLNKYLKRFIDLVESSIKRGIKLTETPSI